MPQSKGTILYIGGFELPDKNAAAHRVLNNAKAFSAIGYNVVFCGIDKTLEWGRNTVHRKVGLFSSYALPYPSDIRQWTQEYFDTKPYIEVLKGYSNVKLVIAYDLNSCHLYCIMKYCKQRGIKIISDCTEWYQYPFSFSPIRFIKVLDTEIRMRFLHKKLDGMIAISRFLADYYKDSVKNLIVVPPLVDVSEEKWLPIARGEGDKINFVYSGQTNKIKDKLGAIIEGFCSENVSSSFCFNVVGITREQYLTMYPKHKDYLNKLKDTVVFRGRVSHRESIDALKSADYSIFIREKTKKNVAGFPTKFVESYTAGVHVITSDVGDIKNYFPQDENSFLIEEDSLETLQAVLKKVLSTDVKQIRCENCRIHENNPFDYRNWMDDFNIFLERP